jgi:hypothetical protein
MIPRVPLREALSDPNLLGTASAGDSWESWRARITNGAYLDGIDGRSAEARRFRDVLGQIVVR